MMNSTNCLDYIPSENDTIYCDFEDDCLNHYNNVSYLNVSCDTIPSLSIPLYGYCTPFLLLITLTANSLIVIVLSQKKMKTTSNSVLLAMALCDMFTLIFPAPGLFYMYTFRNHIKPLASVAACYSWNIFNEAIPAMFHTASIWLTLALAVQRFICVCCGPEARQKCNQNVVNKWIIGICIAAFLHQSTRFFDRSYEVITIEWNGQSTTACHISTAQWVTEYIDIYYTAYFLFRILFVHLIPCASLVTFNVLLFKALQKAQKNREKLLRDNRKKECKTTMMLIVVVTVFLIVEIPLAVLTALHVISTLVYPFLNYYYANFLIICANFFLVVSYPINFAIYCGMSRQFRDTFKELFVKPKVAIKMNPNASCKYSFVNGRRTSTNETVL